ncbi:MAG: hypothetical protein ACQESG_03370 [Nanobdellota archaeon]
MTCVRCGAEEAYKVVNGPFCRNCFLYLIERRVKRHMPRLEPYGRVVCEGVTAVLLHRVVKFPLTIVAPPGDGYVLVERTLDDEAYAFLKNLFEGSLHFSDEPSLVRVLLDEEVALYAKLRGSVFQPREHDPDLREFLEGMQANYKDTKFALAKSMDTLASVVKEFPIREG